MDLVTIIIPVYNVEVYVKKCIDSVIVQTYKKLEIILVDDGSTDNSGNICDSYKKKDKRIKVIHKKNGGLSSARNAGIKQATGNYYVFVDGDDYLSPKMVETLHSDIINNNADISICNRFYINDDGTNKRIRFTGKKKLLLDKKEALIELMSMNNFDMSAWCKIYKSSLFKSITFPEGKTSEDYYIMYKLFDLCEIIIYNPEPLLFYVQRQGSISKTNKLSMDYIYAAKEQMDYISSKYPELDTYAKSAYALSYLTVYNKQLRHAKNISKTITDNFKAKARQFSKSVYHNKKLSFKKKIGFCFFINFTKMYNKIIDNNDGF